MSDPLIEAVRYGWGWTGIEPAAVTATSPFGHAIVRDIEGAFWYLDVELRTLERISADESGLFAHMNDPEVREVWEAQIPLARARELIGEPAPGRCYSRAILSLLKGNFDKDDFWHPPIAELIGAMGDVERQIQSLPEGSPIQIKVVE